MSEGGRLLPFTNATFWFGERPLVGESGHWAASSKSHIYDIRERQLRVESGHLQTSAYGHDRTLGPGLSKIRCSGCAEDLALSRCGVRLVTGGAVHSSEKKRCNGGLRE